MFACVISTLFLLVLPVRPCFIFLIKAIQSRNFVHCILFHGLSCDWFQRSYGKLPFVVIVLPLSLLQLSFPGPSSSAYLYLLRKSNLFKRVLQKAGLKKVQYFLSW